MGGLSDVSNVVWLVCVHVCMSVRDATTAQLHLGVVTALPDVSPPPPDFLQSSSPSARVAAPAAPSTSVPPLQYRVRCDDAALGEVVVLDTNVMV